MGFGAGWLLLFFIPLARAAEPAAETPAAEELVLSSPTLVLPLPVMRAATAAPGAPAGEDQAADGAASGA
jgi:hypothetical protein